MNYRVRLTDTAKQDLRDIAFWIADQSKDIRTARQFVAELRSECKKLELFPEAGSFPKDRILRSSGYRFTVHGNYLIFYVISKETGTVDVMAIFNAKKDYMRVMSKYI